MRLRLWGTRGSIPSPAGAEAIEQKLRAALALAAESGVDLGNAQAVDAFVASLPYAVRGTAGGETACLEVRSAGNLLIFDCGSGLRRLGMELMQQEFGAGTGVAHIFLSHTHWDHILGWPFFVPSFVPGNKLFIYGAHAELEQRFRLQQTAPSMFPIPLDYHAADIEFVQLEQDSTIVVGDSRISNIALNHPGTAFGYRVEDDDGTLVYATDGEYKSLDTDDTAHIVDFFRNADALIFDAMFSLRESYQKEDWGHSSALAGADLATRAGARRLLLFHHDPYATDEQIWDLRDVAEGYLQQHTERTPCQVIVAYDGFELELWRKAELTARVESRSEGTVVRFDGRLVSETATSALEVLSSASEQSAGLPIVIDLAGINYIDSEGLSALFAARRRWCPVVLCGLSQELRRAVKSAGALGYFASFDTVDKTFTALEGMLGSVTGEQLGGRFDVHERIQKRSLGRVYRATDRTGRRQVSLLVLCPSLGQVPTEQILNGARNAARLRHPLIADVVEANQDGPFTYVATEFTSGHSVRERLMNSGGASRSEEATGRADSLPVSEAVRIGEKIAAALEYAHSQNIIHGGLKTDSIIILGDSALKLVDFGVGGVDYGRPLTDLPAYVGSVDYLAPEQLQGRGKSQSTDLYALGVCLYEMLTGIPPFASDDDDQGWNDIVGWQLHQKPVPPRRHNPHISRSLEYLVLDLLHRSPLDRPGSASDARKVLASLLPSQRSGPLLGRDSDVQTLQAHLERVSLGQSGFLIVQGPTGAGKTRLMQSISDFGVNNGTAVLRGEAHAFEDARPYKVFASAIQQAPHRFAGHQLSQMMRELGSLAPALTALVPEIQPTMAVYTQSKVDGRKLEDALCESLRFLAEDGPVMLILDDLEWIDPDSLRLLSRIVRQRIPRLLIVALFGTDTVARKHPLRTALDGLESWIDDEIRLSHLGPIEVYQLASATDAQLPSDFGLWLFGATDGNPLFIEQLLRAYVLQQTGSRIPLDRLSGISLEEVVSLSLESLENRAVGALRQAAVLGQVFSFNRLRAALDRPESDVLAGINAALRTNLVYGDPSEDRYEFSHPLVRQVVYSEMLGSVRRRYHLRAAQVLEQDGVVGVLDDKADQLAHHYLLGGDLAQAINYLARSIRRARQLHAADAAIGYTNSALDAVEQMIVGAASEQERNQRRKQKQDLLSVRDTLLANTANAAHG